MKGLARYFLLDPRVAFLNHGSFGATPRPVFREYRRWQRRLEAQPVDFLGRRAPALLASARADLAAFLSTRPDDLVFTTNVTVALNIVARSLELGPGDQVLTTDHEYGAIDRTWRFLARQQGFEYVRQPIAVPLTSANAFLEQLWSGVTDRTRVIALSHITSPTALIFPVELVAERARRAGILTVVDGAHAPGQIPLRLEALQADFYAGNLHKWLCAPKGVGFLFARPEAQPLLKPLVVSWGWEAENPGPSRFIDEQEWTGTRDLAGFLSVGAAIEFQVRHGWEAVRQECHALAGEVQHRVRELTGREPFHPDDPCWYAQMAGCPLPPGADLERWKTVLYDRFRVEVPLIEWNGHKLLRVSIQGYNSRRDVQRLLDALTWLLKDER